MKIPKRVVVIMASFTMMIIYVHQNRMIKSDSEQFTSLASSIPVYSVDQTLPELAQQAESIVFKGRYLKSLESHFSVEDPDFHDFIECLVDSNKGINYNGYPGDKNMASKILFFMLDYNNHQQANHQILRKSYPLSFEKTKAIHYKSDRFSLLQGVFWRKAEHLLETESNKVELLRGLLHESKVFLTHAQISRPIITFLEKTEDCKFGKILANSDAQMIKFAEEMTVKYCKAQGLAAPHEGYPTIDALFS